MTTRTPARRRLFATPDLDRAIEAAERQAIVMWRGQPVHFDAVPERIARIDDRDARDRLHSGHTKALEALNPLYEQRLAAWMEGGDVAAAVAKRGPDPTTLAAELEPLSLHGETPYHAALRRYLALIDIEQGDATQADLWHVVRGDAWRNWFGDREVGRAMEATGRANGEAGDLDGWRATEHRLAGQATGEDPTVARAIGAAYASLVGSPEWLADELGVDAGDGPQFVDFASFVRLWKLRHLTALLRYELRLYGTDDPAVQRAYYSGIVGHLTGVAVPEAGYLAAVGRPFASVSDLRSAILGGMLIEVLEQRHGLHWWREPEPTQLVERLAGAASVDHALAELGYDALDWRPVLRQIRTRLIGEMSGYGGPNITTRAGTRKV